MVSLSLLVVTTLLQLPGDATPPTHGQDLHAHGSAVAIHQVPDGGKGEEPSSDLLALENAVDLALANHPELRISRGREEVANARADESRGAMLPQLGVSGRQSFSANRRAGTSHTSGAAPYSISLSGDVLVWDFGQTEARWQAAKATAQGTGEDTRAVRGDIIRNVRLAYVDALETFALVEHAQNTRDNAYRYLQQTEVFVEIGVRPQIDIARFQSRLAEAHAALVRAKNDHLLAKVRLNGAMGLSGSPTFQLATHTRFPALVNENEPVEALFQQATSHRPELQAMGSNLTARQLELEASRKRLYPALRVGADLSTAGEGFTEPPGTGASVGMTVNWRLFDGFSSQAAVRANEATLTTERARLAGRSQQLWQEVEQARTQLGSALAQLEAADQSVVSARELLRLAEERYAEGVGTSLELADAELELSGAQAQQVRARYSVAAARALLLHALGKEEWQ